MARETQRTTISVLLALAVHILVVGIIVIRFVNVQDIEAPKGGPAPVQAFAITSNEQIKHWEKILKDPKLLQREKLQAELQRLDQKHKKDQKRAREEEQKKKNEKTKLKAKNKRIKERRKVEAEKKRVDDMRIKKQKARQKKAEQARKVQKAQEKAVADKLRKAERKKKQKAAAQVRKERNKKLKKTRALERAEQIKVARANKKAMEAERLGLKNATANDFSDEKSRYIIAITNAIKGNWTKPPNMPPDVTCNILIKQTITGYVLNFNVRPSVGCNSRFLDSVKVAMKRTKKLPKAPVKEVFEKELDVTFDSNDR